MGLFRILYQYKYDGLLGSFGWPSLIVILIIEMMRSVQLTLLALAGLGNALPQTSNKQYTSTEHDIKYNVFEHGATGSTMKFVANSGLCETTPGVNQYSGYHSVG